ncbi:MAG TPA: cation diffusion facilitator family transporter [Chitinophagaceae bacterium]
MEASKQNLKVQVWITILSLVLFVTKIVAYYETNSLAILSDALESIVNVVAGLIGLYSLYVAAKPEDLEHPSGHGKAEFISAAVEGTLIVGSGLLIIYETVQNFILQRKLYSLDTGLYLVAATAVVNFIAGTVCLRIGNRNKSLALQASGRHLQADTWSTLAIIAGIVLMIVTRLYWLDKVIAILMSVFIIYNGYIIIRRSVAGIMDEADMDLLKEVLEVLNANRRDNWIDLHNLRVIKYGSRLHLDCHLTVPWYLNIHEAHIEVEALEKLIRSGFGESIELFVHTDGCLPLSCPICVKDDCPVRQQPFRQRLVWTLENILSNKKHTIPSI